jgi:HEAT repeat protein
LVALLALDAPSVADLAEYLADPDPQVRLNAVRVLTEHTPDGFAEALIAALSDPAAAVRREAAEGLRELVEVLPSAAGLAEHVDSSDAGVRAVVVDLLRALRAGSSSLFGKAAVDADHRVRIAGVRGLVSLDDVDGLTAAADDDNREVRVAVAQGLATVARGGIDTVRTLAGDRDPLVRAAALTAFAALGADTADAAELARALGDSAWQVRQGAARGLAGASPDAAVAALTEALSDAHLDVRKAAVLSLAAHVPSAPAARAGLASALHDTDADVRAYARRALDGQ